MKDLYYGKRIKGHFEKWLDSHKTFLAIVIAGLFIFIIFYYVPRRKAFVEVKAKADKVDTLLTLVIDLKTIVIAGFSHQDSINIKNKEIEDHIPNISPIALADIKGISTKFNEMRIIDSTGKVEIHSGLDIRADVGTKVYAMASGVAIIAGWDDGWGNRDLINCQNGYEYSISHLSKTFVTKNEIVYKGELIGLVGSTGNSTGPHADVRIYFNGKPVDPKLFF